MLRSYKYRLYPNKSQCELINKHIGSCRFIYNLALETKQIAYVGNRINLSCFDLMNQLPELKQELTWLKEISAQSLQQAITDIDSAYTLFFKGKAEFPKFKKKHQKQSFRVPQSITLENGKLYIPKFKEGIKIIQNRLFSGLIKNVTISRTPTEKYFASILIDTQKLLPPKKKIIEQTTIGIDLGIKTFLVTSGGEAFENPKYLKKKLFKLKFVQRKYAKYKGKRTKYKLALIHERIKNQRKDFLHKVSSKLIRENQTICLEDLNIKGMLQNHNLAQSISDVGWGIFITMLSYKSDWYGKNLLTIGRFDPSSKICSGCGNINTELVLSEREWDCKKCDQHHDRDVNAAINIKNFALRNYLSGEHRHKNRNELPTLVGVMTSEISKKI